MHPRCFEESFVMVFAQYLFTVFAQNFNFLYGLIKLKHVASKARYPGTDCRFFIFLKISFRSVRLVGASSPTLQLAAPNSTKIHVEFSIGVLKNSRINAIASLDGFWFSFKGTCRRSARGYSNTENITFIFYRKIQIVLA